MWGVFMGGYIECHVRGTDIPGENSSMSVIQPHHTTFQYLQTVWCHCIYLVPKLYSNHGEQESKKLQFTSR